MVSYNCWWYILLYLLIKILQFGVFPSLVIVLTIAFPLYMLGASYTGEVFNFSCVIKTIYYRWPASRRKKTTRWQSEWVPLVDDRGWHQVKLQQLVDRYRSAQRITPELHCSCCWWTRKMERWSLLSVQKISLWIQRLIPSKKHKTFITFFINVFVFVFS